MRGACSVGGYFRCGIAARITSKQVSYPLSLYFPVKETSQRPNPFQDSIENQITPTPDENKGKIINTHVHKGSNSYL